MKIFISDLHISSPLFNKEEEVIDLLNRSDVEEIYILGDIFDTWNEDAFLTSVRYHKLINAINRKATVVLKGNHDPSIEDMRIIFNDVPVLNWYRMELFGKDTLLVHGDSVDRMIQFNRLFYFIQYIALHMGFSPKAFLVQTYIDLYKMFKRVSNSTLILGMEKKIVEKHRNDCDLLITGHTHFPKLVKCEDVIFANCGSIIYKPSYLVADNNTLMIKRL